MFKRGEVEERQDQGPIQASEVRMGETAGSEVTVVGQGARLEGTVVSAGSLRIDGQVKGKISAEGDVTLSPQSQVEADIQATNVSVAGKFKGNILAKNRAELARGGRVDGNVTSKTLIVAEGAEFSGQSIMGAGASQPGQAASQPAKSGVEVSEGAGAGATRIVHRPDMSAAGAGPAGEQPKPAPDPAKTG
jgi:cytoskeletal protein CcmA (bactofilin family)